jgi:hypothetical protein
VYNLIESCVVVSVPKGNKDEIPHHLSPLSSSVSACIVQCSHGGFFSCRTRYKGSQDQVEMAKKRVYGAYNARDTAKSDEEEKAFLRLDRWISVL